MHKIREKISTFDKKNIGKLNENRIYIAGIVIFIIMALFAPGFATTANLFSLFKTSLLPITVGLGFTFVMITGHFDLSVGALINLGAILAIGEFNRFFALLGGKSAGMGAVVGAWIIAIALAVLAGALVGMVNGILVGKIKVHSFIVTIGMLTTIGGFVYWYCKGNSISAKDATLAGVIDSPLAHMPILNLFCIRALIVIILVVLLEIFLQKTKVGRSFFMVGSNLEAAWHAGINTEKYTIASFIISGTMAALGGALFAISMNTAVPNYGERGISPLMLVLASTIIGGTAMTGGKGSVVKTAVAVLTMQAIFNGLICMGQQFDAQILSAGLLLGLVVFYEAYVIYKQNLKKGQRPALLEEAELLKTSNR